MRKRASLIALTILGSAMSVPATAATYAFNFNNGNAVWQLPSSPTPTGTSADRFTIEPVPATAWGSPISARLIFFAPSSSGGFALTNLADNGVLFSAVGETLYTGTLSNPTFKLGTFKLGDSFFENVTYTLTITQVAGGVVPEPATWAMMILGFGAIGSAMRSARRQQKVAVSFG